jgi:putative transposase
VYELTALALAVACEKQQCKAPVFILMPDHAHFLLIGEEPQSDLLAAMDYVKWRTGSQFASKNLDVAWESGYYDTIARAGEKWAMHARYIALNSVRAGLVENPEEWPFVGSVGYRLEDVLQDAFES